MVMLGPISPIFRCDDFVFSTSPLPLALVPLFSVLVRVAGDDCLLVGINRSKRQPDWEFCNEHRTATDIAYNVKKVKVDNVNLLQK